MSMKLAIRSASAGAEVTPCTALTSSAGVCGSSCRTSSAWLRRCSSRASISVFCSSDSGTRLDARHEKRIAVEEFGDAKAPLALADHVMAAVRARHIAQQIRLGPDAVQIDRQRVVGRRLALQHQPDRAAEADRGLRRDDRALPPQRHRQHRAGKQHEVARRDQDQRVRRDRQADLGAAGHDNGRRLPAAGGLSRCGICCSFRASSP